MARVQIKLAADTEWYTFSINPLEFDDQDSYEYDSTRTVDGKSVEQYSYYDGRIKTMTWKNLPNKAPYAGDATALVEKLKTYVLAGECHLKLKDLSKISSSHIDYIKVIDISTSLAPGAGPETASGHLKYDTVQLKYINILPA